MCQILCALVLGLGRLGKEIGQALHKKLQNAGRDNWNQKNWRVSSQLGFASASEFASWIWDFDDSRPEIARLRFENIFRYELELERAQHAF